MKTALQIALLVLALSITSSRAADAPPEVLFPITIRSFEIKAGGCTFVDQNNRTFTVQANPQLALAVVTAAAQNLSIGVSGTHAPASEIVVVHAIFWPGDDAHAESYRKAKSSKQ